MKEEDIIKYDNVPVKITAEYLGVSQQFVRWQMKHGKLPIGNVKTNPQGKNKYYISPGKLISYKTGKDYHEVEKEINFDRKYKDLLKLKELLDKNILNLTEFEQEKKKILNN